jgi:hypothetical protein
MRGRASLWVVSMIAIVAVGVTISTVAADQTAGKRTVVIYPGDYVVQSGDLTPEGVWREGVVPSAVVARQGDSMVQATDFEVLARYRIDVNSATGQVGIEAVPTSPEKADMSPYLTSVVGSCTDCNGNASTTRNIRLNGTYDAFPHDCAWINPLIGYPSTPASANVASVGSGVFDFPAYNNGNAFQVDFPVTMASWGSFQVWVDVLGDFTGEFCDLLP